jgi:hypothetical protein
MASESQGDDKTKPSAPNQAKADNSFNWDSFDAPSGGDAFDFDEVPSPPKTKPPSEKKSNADAAFDFDEFDKVPSPPKTKPPSEKKSNADAAFDFDEFDLDKADVGFDDFGTKEQNRTPAAPAPVYQPAQPPAGKLEFTITAEEGWLLLFENASLNKIVWITASTVGLVAALAVAAVVYGVTVTTPRDIQAAVMFRLFKTAWLMSLVAGIAAFSASLFLWKNIIKHLKLRS